MEPGTSPSKEELLALLQQARERADHASQRAEQAEALNRNITFAEYLEACHRFISRPLAVQTDRSLTTKGSITSPIGRLCPTYLKSWDFHSAQQSLFDEVYRFFHPTSDSPMRVFPPLLVIEDRGQLACGRPLASEADLRRHQEAEVENPVREVIDRLARLPEARSMFSLAEGVTFENHANTITEEPGQAHLTSTRPTQADQNCVYRRSGNERSLLYVIEYKAAHKLPDSFLRSGLQDMNMWEDVVQQQASIPLDTDEKLLYDSLYLSCAALTQTFDYMMKGGCKYSTLTNGRLKVILRILEEDPETLYYCVVEPGRDAEPNYDDPFGFRYPYTAISYQLCLTLMALQSPPRSQLWRNQAMDRLHKWEVDFEEVIRSIPESDRKKSPPDSDYKSPRYPIDPRSPYLLRRRLLPDKLDYSKFINRDPSPGPSSESDSGPTRIPSSPVDHLRRTKRRRTANSQPRSSQVSRQSRPPNQEYCTQACLRGLFSQSQLDPNCPNFLLHRKYSTDGQHLLSCSNLVELVSQQLNNNPDCCCRPLQKEGIHGSMFAITLEKYGYTFVGKGTEYNSVYEGEIYQKLRRLQGSAVPVYLGDIFLRENVYFLGPTRVIIHMSLMAWGGVALKDADLADCQRQVERTKIEIHGAGVEHLDLRAPNMLWNEEMQRIMFIDFGRAKVNRKRKGSTLAPILPQSKRPTGRYLRYRVAV
ncbi:hypothetical protein BBP40_007921 [Aspergillus hancockii]|nr:hypothetical protein BBP40_007921 [Aspergillus hancockii]